MELSLNNVGNWPKQFKALLLVVLFLLIVFLGYWLHNRAQLQELNMLVQQEEKLKNDFKIQYTSLTELQVIEKNSNENEKFLETISNDAPIYRQVQQFLEDVTKIAAQENVVVKSLKPSSDEKQPFFIRAPIRMVVVGKYHELSNFLSAVAQSNQSVAFDEFRMEQEPKQSEEEANTNDRLELYLTAIIFHYESSEDASA